VYAWGCGSQLDLQQQWNLGLPGGPRWAGCGAGLAFPHVFFIKTNGTHASSGGAAAALEQRRKKLPAQTTFVVCVVHFIFPPSFQSR
jgi:hypothetical protein